MQPVNESGDVERLLDVLGVPELPYQTFSKPVNPRPFESAAADRARIEAAFPLLAAALPELAGVASLRPADPKPPEPFVPRPSRDIAEDAVAPIPHSPAVVAPPPPRPAPPRAATVAALPAAPPFHAQAAAPPVPASACPPETQIQAVFNILRGTPVQPDAETASQRGIRTLFHRP